MQTKMQAPNPMVTHFAHLPAESAAVAMAAYTALTLHTLTYKESKAMLAAVLAAEAAIPVYKAKACR